MLIKVTQEDIDKGVRCNPCKCPLALAIKRCLGVTHKVYVSVGGVLIGWDTYTLPTEANLLRRSFDQGLHISPFEFVLDMRVEKCSQN